MPATERPVFERWMELDPQAGPKVEWVRAVPSRVIVVLMGAFDPPTLAHLSIVRAASRARRASGVLCLTKLTLDRPGERLLADEDRIRILERLAHEEDLGFAMTNGATYLDAHRAMRAEGLDATFVIGSDKLAQLEDASFYPDPDGPAATFAEVAFLVVPREGAAIDRDDVQVLDPSEVFDDPAVAIVSATRVRRLLRAGRPVDAIVPPVVAESLAGYTAAEPR